MSHFGLIESFNIDDGQLDDCSKQSCFVLGYEFCQVCHKLDSFSSGNGQLIHVANLDRLRSAAAKRSKVLTVKFLQDDRSEEWCEIGWRHS